MRRFSVFVTAATADLFGFSDAQSIAAIAQPGVITVTTDMQNPMNPSPGVVGVITGVAPADVPPVASTMDVVGATSIMSASETPQTIGASSVPGSIGDASAPAEASQTTRNGLLAPTTPTDQGGADNAIPDSAAGGIGSYLNQIAAELSDNGETTAAAGSPLAGLMYSVNAPLIAAVSGATDLTGAVSADIPMESVEEALDNAARDSTLAVIESTSDGWSTNTDLTTLSSGSAFVTTSQGDLIAAIDGERRKESSVGTAAAAGGLFLLGAGACGLYARNRRAQPAELSRFGSPQRRTSSDMPRRFVPV